MNLPYVRTRSAHFLQPILRAFSRSSSDDLLIDHCFPDDLLLLNRDGDLVKGDDRRDITDDDPALLLVEEAVVLAFGIIRSTAFA